MADQLDLLAPPVTAPKHQVAVLADIIAGMRWPGHGGFAKLPKAHQAAATDAAQQALDRLYSMHAD